MGAKRVEFHESASAEYEAAVKWYLERSEWIAATLAAHKTRRFVLQQFPYAIVYRETVPTIQVLAVAHGRRKPGFWKKRL